MPKHVASGLSPEQFERLKNQKPLDERLAASQAALEAHRATQALPTAFAPAGECLPLERMRDCLLPDSHPDAPVLRNGVARRADGSLFVATAVAFPGVDTAAFAWWFSAGCPGDEEYRTWHPEDHVSGHFVTAGDSSADGEPLPGEPWAGLEHVVVEALGAKFGGRPQSLRIKFKPTAAYGLDRAALQGARCDVALAARVCVRDAALGWLDVGHFLHFTQPLPGGAAGFELRSRFWLGDVDLPAEVSACLNARCCTYLHVDSDTVCSRGFFRVFFLLGPRLGKSHQTRVGSRRAAGGEHPGDAQRVRAAHRRPLAA